MIQRNSGMSQPSSLAVLVECAVSPLLRQHSAPILFELNIDIDLMTTASREHLTRLIESLITDSLREMPEGGELTVSGCQTANGVELEIADTGSDAEHRSRSLSISAAALGCKPHWQNCPQGGAAVTIVLPFSNVARKAA
jgi:hypothetical protein